MNKILTGLLVVLFFLTLLGLLLWKLFAPAVPEQTPVNVTSTNPFGTSATVTNTPNTLATNDPETTTKNCYAWYIKDLDNNVARNSAELHESNKAQCFTPAFLGQWGTVVEETDADPVILAQDFQNSWVQNMSTQVISQTSSSASVLLTMGKGAETYQLTVALLLDASGTWKIDNVSN